MIYYAAISKVKFCFLVAIMSSLTRPSFPSSIENLSFSMLLIYLIFTIEPQKKILYLDNNIHLFDQSMLHYFDIDY